MSVGRWGEAAGALEEARRFDLAGSVEWSYELSAGLLAVLRGVPSWSAREASFNFAFFWASFRFPVERALWADRPVEARDAVRRALSIVDERLQVSVRSLGWAYALGLRAEADIAASARARRAEPEVDEVLANGADLMVRMEALKVEVDEKRPYYTPMASR